MIHTFKLGITELWAMSLFMSEDESRLAICGVRIELPAGHNRARLIATDGRRLALLESAELIDSPPTEGKAFTLPAALVRQCAGLEDKAPEKNDEVNGSYDEVTGALNLRVNGSEYTGTVPQAPAAKYPKWREVIPKTVPPKQVPPVFPANLIFLHSFQRALSALKGESSRLRATTQVRVRAVSEPFEITDRVFARFYGLLMPLNVNDDPEPAGAPDWAKVEMETKAAA